MAIPKRLPYLLILALVGNLLLVGGPWAGAAYACSCAGTSSSEEALQSSDAVFSGEVVEIGQLPPEPPLPAPRR